MILHLDFETRSKIDLRTQGLDRYARDPSTDITVMCYAFDDEPVQKWYPGMQLPPRVELHVRRLGDVVAHNSQFEWNIWNHVCVRKYGATTLHLGQTDCTMARANALGFMSSLENAAMSVGIKSEKHAKGYRVMMKLTKPNKDGEFYTRETNPEDFALLDEYCAQDVEIERKLSKVLPPLTEKERKIWLLDKKINARGFSVDVKNAQRLNTLIDLDRKRLVEEFTHLTEGAVATPSSHAAFKKWLARNGLEMESIAKDKVAEIRTTTKLSPKVEAALKIRSEYSKTSNAKIQSMLNLHVDGVVRNCFEYYGAKQTGRWAGRGLQPQNFPRGNLKQKEVDSIFGLLDKNLQDSLFMIYDSVPDMASSLIRSLIVAKPGHKFVVSDFSAIEGRGLAWLAGEQWVLDYYRDFDAGKIKYDTYEMSYARAFKKALEAITKDDRLIGKIMELAFGFQGAVGSFHGMAKNYGVSIPDDEAKILVDAWRESRPLTVKFWYAMENAAIAAVKNPTKVFTVQNTPTAPKIIFQKRGHFLRITYPSGRFSFYPFAKVEEIDTPWGAKKQAVTYQYEDSFTRKWTRGPIYGGSITENVTQGICRDLLAEALLRCEDINYPVHIHVHDEIVAQVELSKSIKPFEDAMGFVPEWARGFPIAAKGFETVRYRKD